MEIIGRQCQEHIVLFPKMQLPLVTQGQLKKLPLSVIWKSVWIALILQY